MKRSRKRNLAHFAVCLGLLAAAAGPAQAQQPWTQTQRPPDFAEGWGPLPAFARSAVGDFMIANAVIGATVAVSKDGRLVYSGGFGSAGSLNGGPLRPMTRDMRGPIGSISKALVTGPAATMLAAARGQDPSTLLLYGPGRLYGSRFDLDIDLARQRFGPLAAAAIGSGDTVFMYYRNGTFGAGSSTDVTLLSRPLPYALPLGKSPADLVDVSVDEDGVMMAWYRDGTYSAGHPQNLASFFYSPNHPLPDRVSLPPGKLMSDIVAIATAKSDGDVYVWYDDGEVSHGTINDFDAVGPPVPFSVPNEGVLMSEPTRQYTIVGCGISASDATFCWYGDETVSSGSTTDLDARHPLTPVKTHQLEPMFAMDYNLITLQHLLDHESGLRGSGDEDGTAVTFPPPPPIDYASVHAHHIRTFPLGSVPGAEYEYSNHGFGSMTLAIEALANQGPLSMAALQGQNALETEALAQDGIIAVEPFTQLSYEDYVVDLHLPALGVAGVVVPRPNPPAVAGETTTFVQDDDGPPTAGPPVPFELGPIGLGLASGGWHGAAEDVLAVAVALSDRFTIAELLDMGWRGTEEGGVNHPGGGASYNTRVAIFADGFAPDGVDLGGVQVAILLNTNLPSGASFTQIMRDLARIAGILEIPESYDLFD